MQMPSGADSARSWEVLVHDVGLILRNPLHVACQSASAGRAPQVRRRSKVDTCPRLEVLFISGTSGGYKWGSFTVRGRQAARGLRRLRAVGPAIRARAWNSDCEQWCAQPPAPAPQVVVHVKYPCRCAMRLLAGARHVYDPVDQFAVVPEGVHALLAQTSLAAEDYSTHPSAVAGGVAVYWHPLHHSNFGNITVPSGLLRRAAPSVDLRCTDACVVLLFCWCRTRPCTISAPK